MSGSWLSMNTLMLDTKRVVVADHETNLIYALRGWGFDPIPCPFDAFYRLGGSIHCATLDVRRRGCLESYFSDAGGVP
jgi:glycine amidinotransferase